jgi:hypothetical protein
MGNIAFSIEVVNAGRSNRRQVIACSDKPCSSKDGDRTRICSCVISNDAIILPPLACPGALDDANSSHDGY